MFNKSTILKITTLCIMLCSLTVVTNTVAAAGFVPQVKSDSIHGKRANVESDAERAEKIKKAVGRKVSGKPAIGGLTSNPLDMKTTDRYGRIIEGKGNPRFEPLKASDTIRRKIKFINRVSVGAFGGVSSYLKLNDVSFTPSVTIGAFATCQLKPAHALRLSASLTRFKSHQLASTLQTFQVGADYMFHLSNYIYGLNEKRILNIEPTVGIGMLTTRTLVGNQLSPYGRIGLNVAFKLNSNSSIFFEPFALVTDSKSNMTNVAALRMNNVLDPIEGKNPRRYNMQWGIWAGLRAHVERKQTVTKLRMPTFNPNTFFDFGAGFTFYRDMPLIMNGPRVGLSSQMRRSMGGNVSLTTGRWFDPILGASIGLYASDFYWRYDLTEGSTTRRGNIISSRGVSTGVRVEMLARPFNMIRLWRELPRRFDFEISGGFELGAIYKHAVPVYSENLQPTGEARRILSFNIGYTIGAKMLCRIAPNSHLFLEPRLNWINYNYDRAINSREGNFTERLWQLNAGIRIQRPTKQERSSTFDGEFRRGLMVGVSGGALKHLGESKLQSCYPQNWSAGLSVTYDITPYHGIMFAGEYMRHNLQGVYGFTIGDDPTTYMGNFTRVRHLAGFKLQYRLNLTNLLVQRDFERRFFNLYGVLGPSYTIAIGHKFNNNDGYEGTLNVIDNSEYKNVGAFGISGGFIAAFHISEKLSFNLMPEFYYHFNDRIIYGTESDVKSMVKFQAGFEYKF